MFPIREFEKRFREILSEVDAVREEASEEFAESLDELNADFEDALFVMECTGDSEDDWMEAIEDVLAELRDLSKAYEALIPVLPAVALPQKRLEMAICLAEGNLQA